MWAFFPLVHKAMNAIKYMSVLATLRKIGSLGGLMEKAKLDEYRRNLLQLKSKILNTGLLKKADDLAVSTDDLADETDLATSVISQQVTFNMRDRELNKLRMIEEALMRIEDGTYGMCEDCDEEIGEKRLKTQPWTTLCITHAEEREREKNKFAKAG